MECRGVYMGVMVSEATAQAIVHGGSTITASDLAIARGAFQWGDSEKLCDKVSKAHSEAGRRCMLEMVSRAIESMKTQPDPEALILVGGGAVLLADVQADELAGVSEILRPKHAGVANALGAAVGQASGTVDVMMKLPEKERDDLLAEVIERAKKRAIAAGAIPESVTVRHQRTVNAPYMGGDYERVTVKCVGDIDFAAVAQLQRPDCSEEGRRSEASIKEDALEEDSVEQQQPPSSLPTYQMIQAGQFIDSELHFDDDGAWILNERDTEFIANGAAVLGAGACGTHDDTECC